MKMIQRGATMAAGALTLLSLDATARPFLLIDGPSAAYYDPASIGGMTDWVVGGQDHLSSQSFWVRTAADSRELPLSSLYQSSSGLGNYAQASFGVSGLYSINISYTLTSQSLEKAQIVESILIKNLSQSSLNLNFYQYNNFDLGGDGGGITAGC